MEDNPPRYPHTKYEYEFLISGCRDIHNNNNKKNVFIADVNGRMERRKDGETNGTDGNYIPRMPGGGRYKYEPTNQTYLIYVSLHMRMLGVLYTLTSL